MPEKIQELSLVFSFLVTQFPGNIGGKGASCLKDIFTASKTTNEGEKKATRLRTRCQNRLASNTSSQLTVHKLLLLLGQDAGQVATLQPTFPLCCVPRAPVCHVLIAVGLKLLPTEPANLRVWEEGRIIEVRVWGFYHDVAWMRLRDAAHQSLIQTGTYFTTRIFMLSVYIMLPTASFWLLPL